VRLRSNPLVKPFRINTSLLPCWYLFCNGHSRGGNKERGIDDTQATTSRTNRGHCYRVEVSGWDAKENFFVEKTSLDWGEREGKTVARHASVRIDSVLFVRLLRPLGGGADFPVPHRAVRVEDREKDASRRDVELEQLQPPKAAKECAAAAIESLIQGSLHG
jgi:hypothetical protein